GVPNLQQIAGEVRTPYFLTKTVSLQAGGGPRRASAGRAHRAHVARAPEHPMIQIKRVYESPAAGDGRRILVERLWPRGLNKAALDADGWLKDVAPSTELRKWYDHRVERWPEFQRRYRAELDANPDAWKPLLDAGARGTVTLLFSARDVDHNSAVVLREYLASKRPPRRSTGGGSSARASRTRRSPTPRGRRTRTRTRSRP